MDRTTAFLQSLSGNAPSTTTEAARGSFEARLQQAIDTSCAQTPNSHCDGNDLSVFNPSASRKDPVIVLKVTRGRFPAETENDLISTVTALKTLPEAASTSGGIHVSVFGTAGGVDPKVTPGTVVPVTGSVFVGTEVSPSVAKGPTTYRAVIALNDTGHPGRSYFYTQDGFKTQGEADQAAQTAFINGTPLVAKEGPYAGKTLQAATSEVSSRSGGTVSLTVDTFATQPIKIAAEKYGISNANMEDFLTFESLAGKVNSLGVGRLITDPSVITQSFGASLSNWQTKASYPEDSYIDAIQWGLKSREASAVPASARWSLTDQLSPSDQHALTSEVYMPKLHGKATALDPFYADIATDFLDSAVRGDLFCYAGRPRQGCFLWPCGKPPEPGREKTAESADGRKEPSASSSRSKDCRRFSGPCFDQSVRRPNPEFRSLERAGPSSFRAENRGCGGRLSLAKKSACEEPASSPRTR